MANAVYLDSGHGGGDPGAAGNGVVGRDHNAAVIRRIATRLRQHGIRTYCDLDVGNPNLAGALADARRHATEVKLYYAQHHNAATASARGYEIYKTGADRSLRFARAVHAAHLRALRSIDATIPDRGVKEARGTRAEAAVVRSPGSSVLSELLFLSNARDAAIAKHPAYFARISEATVKAIVEFGRVEKLWTIAYKAPAPAPAPTPTDPCASCKRSLADAQRKIAAAKGALS